MTNKRPVYLIKNGVAENKESRSCIDNWKYVAELGKIISSIDRLPESEP